MKNLIKLLFVAAALVSCDDSLDRLPVDQLVPATAYNTVEDLQLGVSGMYDTYPTYSELLVNSLATDNTVIGEDNGGQDVQLHNLNLNPSGGDQGIYSSYSRLANLASRVIENASFLNIDSANTDDIATRDNLVGQAYATRAFAHLKMFEYFTPDYTNPSGLSVPYVDFVALSSDFPARETVADFAAKIDADFTQAETLLADNNGIDVFNKNSVTFMRARFALATGANIDAINFATTLISNSGTSLANQTAYVNMFSDLDQSEVIFQRVYTQADAARIAGPWFFTGTGGEKWEVSNDLLAEIDPINDPARAQVLVLNGATSAPFGVGKYPGSNGLNFLNNMKEMRISELYLIRAEAHARENQLGQAASSIQSLRDQRLVSSPVVAYTTQAEALDDILAERRLELAFEGHRWKDLKRFNQGFTRNAMDCGGATPCQLNAGDFRFTLPLPLTEVLNNPNITENNPGY